MPYEPIVDVPAIAPRESHLEMRTSIVVWRATVN